MSDPRSFLARLDGHGLGAAVGVVALGASVHGFLAYWLAIRNLPSPAQESITVATFFFGLAMNVLGWLLVWVLTGVVLYVVTGNEERMFAAAGWAAAPFVAVGMLLAVAAWPFPVGPDALACSVVGFIVTFWRIG